VINTGLSMLKTVIAFPQFEPGMPTRRFLVILS
jgi:hypothetical protein